MSKCTKYLAACLSLLISIFSLQLNVNLVVGQGNPYLPTIGGSEFPVLVTDSGVYFLDIDIVDINSTSGVLPDNLQIKAYRYSLESGEQYGTWEDVTLENQIPIRAGAAICQLNRKLYFYGGAVINPNDPTQYTVFSDLKLFEIEANNPLLGRFIDPPINSSYKPPLTADSECYTVGDSLNITGGVSISNPASPNPLPDYSLKEYNTRNDEWQLLNDYSFETPLTGLDSEYDSIIWQDGSTLNVLGKNSNNDKFALWQVINGNWEQAPTSTPPDYLEGFTYTQGPDGALYFYGGIDAGGAYEQSLFRVQNGLFSIIPANGPMPPARTEAKMVFYQNKIFVFGGENDDIYPEMGNDIWSFDLASKVWTNRTVLPPATSISPYPLSPDGPEDYFTGDVLVSANIRTNTNIIGQERKCSILKKKKKKDRIYGNSQTNIAFLYGDRWDVELDTQPITTYTKDNRLTFEATVTNANKERRILGAYWQIEDREGFKGFDESFLDDLIEPIEEMSVTDPNPSEGPDVEFDEELLKKVRTANPLANSNNFEDGYYTQGTDGDPSKVRVAFSETFPPGHYRVHLTALVFDPNLIQQTLQYNYSGNLKVKACGKVFDVPPYVASPGDNRLQYYYITHVFEFDVPEFTNFSDIASVNASQPYMEDGYVVMHNRQPPNLINSFRPIFYGHLAAPGAQIIPYMGQVDVTTNSQNIVLVPLNDNPFGNETDIKTGTIDRLRLNANRAGDFAFQPLNIMPINVPDRRDIPPYYDLRLLSIDQYQNIIGAPPVRVATIQERTFPRIYNFADHGQTNSPQPVFIGSYLPNRRFVVKQNAQEVAVIADAEGNFRFQLPEPLVSGSNTFEMSDWLDSSYKRNFEITFVANSALLAPQITNIISNNSLATNLPVFNGHYQANSTLSYVFDPGLSSEKSGTVSTDSNGRFWIQTTYLDGEGPNSTGNGMHSLFVADGPAEARIEFKIQEKNFSAPTNANILFPSRDQLLNLPDGGSVKINNQFALYLESGGQLKVLSDNTHLRLPAGTTIYRAVNGKRETVVGEGVFTLQSNDAVLIGYRGALIQITDTGAQDLLLPAYTLISALENNASLTYLDGGKIISSDPLEINNAAIESINLPNYFVRPQYDMAQVYNYQNGDLITSQNPVFLGSATANSVIEVWRKTTRAQSSESRDSDFEHIVATTPVDSRGRFEIKVSAPMEVDTEYEFAFVNRLHQAPAYRINLKTASSLNTAENIAPYSDLSDYSYASSPLNPDHQQLRLKRLPLEWTNTIWSF